MRLILLSVLTVGAGVALSGGVRAEDQGAGYDPRQAFAETDTDRDGEIDLAEFHARVVDVFYIADTNKDGSLSPEEYQRLPFSADFKNADINGDGKISLHEFVANRFLQFQAADTNHDGELSLDEVLTAYKGRTKK